MSKNSVRSGKAMASKAGKELKKGKNSIIESLAGGVLVNRKKENKKKKK